MNEMILSSKILDCITLNKHWYVFEAAQFKMKAMKHSSIIHYHNIQDMHVTIFVATSNVGKITNPASTLSSNIGNSSELNDARVSSRVS